MEFRPITREEYEKSIKIKRRYHRVNRTGKNQQLLAAFIGGTQQHAIIACDDEKSARSRYNALRATAAKSGIEIKIALRHGQILLSKI